MAARSLFAALTRQTSVSNTAAMWPTRQRPASRRRGAMLPLATAEATSTSGTSQTRSSRCNARPSLSAAGSATLRGVCAPNRTESLTGRWRKQAHHRGRRRPRSVWARIHERHRQLGRRNLGALGRGDGCEHARPAALQSCHGVGRCQHRLLPRSALQVCSLFARAHAFCPRRGFLSRWSVPRVGWCGWQDLFIRRKDRRHDQRGGLGRRLTSRWNHLCVLVGSHEQLCGHGRCGRHHPYVVRCR